MTEKYQYISKKTCRRESCPVVQRETIGLREDGHDEYRFFETTEQMFDRQKFAACYICHSHVQVEKFGTFSRYGKQED